MFSQLLLVVETIKKRFNTRFFFLEEGYMTSGFVYFNPPCEIVASMLP